MAASGPLVVKSTAGRTLVHTPGGLLRMFDASEHDLPGVCVLVSTNPAGGGPPEHWHPHDEMYVLFEGRGTYTANGVDVDAEDGDIVIVPAYSLHSFRAAEGPTLRHIALYMGPTLVTNFGRVTEE